MQSTLRRLDLRSALIGLGVAGSLVFLTSLTVPTPPVKTIRISNDPDPASVVRIAEGETFKVPEKLRLVLKAATMGSSITGILVRINGETVLNGHVPDSPMMTLGFPLVAQPGDVVSVEESFPDPDNAASVLGYLAE